MGVCPASGQSAQPRAEGGRRKPATGLINVRVDPVLKEKAEQLFSDLGMNMSTAINIFLKSAVNYSGIPFEVRKYVPNEETRAALAEYEAMKSDPTAYKRYDSMEALVSEVLNDA